MQANSQSRTARHGLKSVFASHSRVRPREEMPRSTFRNSKRPFKPSVALFTLLPVILWLASAAICARAEAHAATDQTLSLSPEQAALVDRAMDREKALIKNIQLRTPLVETYIQTTHPESNPDLVPSDDVYMLSRVDFSKTFTSRVYEPRGTARHGRLKGSAEAISGLSKALRLDSRFLYNPTGFMEMMFIDPIGFDRQHYAFTYLRREVLGSVSTYVYEVRPIVKGMGRFFGNIWIEDQDGNIVRFSGGYTGPGFHEDPTRHYFHFDSWRANVQPGVWLPVAVYVAENELNEGHKTFSLKAQTHFWGYSLNLPTREGENVTVQVDDAVDKSEDSQDVSPLQATHAWIDQAEVNVVDRLVEAGLLAPLNPDGYETQVLDRIVENLNPANRLALTEPVHCRVLLTTTLEATTVGSTILISKGLLDTLPNEESIASVLAMELGHVALGHHIDTRYAFNDRLMFPDTATFQRIGMQHSDAENIAAAHKAMEYLEASVYKDRLPNAAMYHAQLADREKSLKALTTPKLGDSLLSADGTPWLADLARMSPRLASGQVSTTAALPLGNWLRIDPWDDKVQMLNVKNATSATRGRMPLEVMPISFTLERYDQALAQPPAPAQ